MPTGTLEKLTARIGAALAELEPLLAPDHAVTFFEQLGTRFPEELATDPDVRPALDAASAAAGGIAPRLAAFFDAEQQGDTPAGTAAVIFQGGQVILQIGTLIEKLTDVIGEIGAKSWPPLTAQQVQQFAQGFPLRVLENAVVRNLEVGRPEFASALVLMGAIDRSQTPVVGAGVDEPPTFARRLDLGQITGALSDPASHFRGLVGWGDAAFDPSRLLVLLQGLIELFTSNTVIDTSLGSPVLTTTLMTVRKSASVADGIDLSLSFGIPDGFTFAVPVGTGYEVNLSATGELPTGTVITARPPSILRVEAPVSIRFESRLVRTPVAPETAVVLLGATGATRLEVASLAISAGLELGSSGGASTGDVFTRFAVEGGKAVVDFGAGDGFLKSLVPGNKIEAGFQLAATYSLTSGLTFEAGATLEIRIPLHVSFGGVEINGLNLSFPIGQPGRQGLPIDLATSLTTTFGPFTLVVDGVGLKLDLVLGSGQLGIGDVLLAPRFPTGIGVSIDGGGISGGGFLSHDPVTGRYAGAIELRVFLIGVKAFGILDTRFPDGTEGVSFVVVIVAEFTPIQLGFGFTLVGVGGLLGINRSVDDQALGDAVRTGSLEHLLFPRNPVQDAPAIINDLATVFPATRDHQLFGPMAKFGWGTPTLITGDLGIILEFPGPRLAILGVVRMQLPSAEFALMNLQMTVAGLLDFPAGKISIDASLFDSYVAGYVVSGDMAFRLETVGRPFFLLSVGGFNSGFHPPAQFPRLSRASVALGINGNPSLTAEGYFALTSNTAQIGAGIYLRASGAGIRLRGDLGFDVLFQFSPFRFQADFHAGVHIDFHGFGFGMTLHGTLSGPTPWHVRGRICVDVEIWEACLTVEKTFGRAQPAALPEMDPWFGTDLVPNIDPRIQVIGLGSAVSDSRNWEGEAPPAGFSVVSLAAASTADRTPIDPLGAATLRQKVCPLEQELEKFGEYQPIEHTVFRIDSVRLNGVLLQDTEFETVVDDFAPANFAELSKSERLSAPSYTEMIGGISLAPSRVKAGPSGNATLEYETVFITAEGDRVVEEPGEPRFTLTQQQLIALLARSFSARGGARRAGAEKYKLHGRPKLLTFDPPSFVVVDACSHAQNSSITPTEVSHTQALLALRAHVRNNPGDQNRFAVVPFFAAA